MKTRRATPAPAGVIEEQYRLAVNHVDFHVKVHVKGVL